MKNKKNLKKSYIIISSMLIALLLIGLFIPTSKAQYNISNEYSKESVKNNVIKSTQDGIIITKTAN